MKNIIILVTLLTSLSSYANISVLCRGGKIVDTEHINNFSVEVGLGNGSGRIIHSFNDGVVASIQKMNKYRNYYKISLKDNNNSLKIHSLSVSGMASVAYTLNGHEYFVGCNPLTL